MRGPSIERGIDGLTAQKSETLSDQFFLGVSVGRKKLTGVGWWPGVVRLPGALPIVTLFSCLFSCLFLDATATPLFLDATAAPLFSCLLLDPPLFVAGSLPPGRKKIDGGRGQVGVKWPASQLQAQLPY